MQQITDALGRLARGEDSLAAVASAMDRAVRTAIDLAYDTEQQRSETRSASFAEVVGANVKAMRNDSDTTQAAVADAMAALGFDWKRITCAEVELATRRVAIEEVLALAVLFGVPAIELFLPADDAVITWPQGDLPRRDLVELFVGHGGELGEGGINWRTAARAAGRPRTRTQQRPAVAFWTNRGERRTQPSSSSRAAPAPSKKRKT